MSFFFFFIFFKKENDDRKNYFLSINSSPATPILSGGNASTKTVIASIGKP